MTDFLLCCHATLSRLLPPCSFTVSVIVMSILRNVFVIKKISVLWLLSAPQYFQNSRVCSATKLPRNLLTCLWPDSPLERVENTILAVCEQELGETCQTCLPLVSHLPASSLPPHSAEESSLHCSCRGNIPCCCEEDDGCIKVSTVSLETAGLLQILSQQRFIVGLPSLFIQWWDISLSPNSLCETWPRIIFIYLLFFNITSVQSFFFFLPHFVLLFWRGRRSLHCLCHGQGQPFCAWELKGYSASRVIDAMTNT